jgi:hypothetical protein
LTGSIKEGICTGGSAGCGDVFEGSPMGGALTGGDSGATATEPFSFDVLLWLRLISL